MPEGERNRGAEGEASAQQREADKKWTKNASLFFAALGLLGLTAYAVQYLFGTAWPRWQQFFDVFGRGLLIASASFLVGILLGFVFGIPRALQTPSQLGSESHGQGKSEGVQVPSLGPAYQVNTNFEQISDWLTKIIVGVGLVEMAKFPDLFRRLGNYLAPCLGDLCKSPSVAVVIVILFAVLGFLAGYLFMRLYFTGAFRRAEVVPAGEIQGSIKEWGDEDLNIKVEPVGK